MKRWLPISLLLVSAFFCGLVSSRAQSAAEQDTLASLTVQRKYVQKRVSSYDKTGGNADAITIPAGQTATILDASGPGIITHLWSTVSAADPWHLKELVLRMYWDGEANPSVEAPIGDFFGLGLGQYFMYSSTPLSVGGDKALNCFFQMPFQKSARITVTNESTLPVSSFYFNIDYQAWPNKLPGEPLYFHASYRQAAPNKGTMTAWKDNGDPAANGVKNLDGTGNYTWMEAAGHGQFVGVTMSILQNQDYWWGEGDDMFFVDGEKLPSVNGTGGEDYFLGAWGFGTHSFSYPTYGAPVIGSELAGSRTSIYRFHLDSPIPFTKSIRATMEHGHANHRSDNWFSVAYWYQAEPHQPFPALPPADARLPRLYPVGGPGNSAVSAPVVP